MAVPDGGSDGGAPRHPVHLRGGSPHDESADRRCPTPRRRIGPARRNSTHRPPSGSRRLHRQSLPALCPPAGGRARRPQRHARPVVRRPARRRGHRVPRSGHLLLLQGDHGLRDRCRVRHTADHDAHRPAGPHPLPRPGPARLPSDLHAGTRGRDPAPGPGTGGPHRARRADRRGRRPGRAVAAPGDQRPARGARGRVAHLLQVVRGRHPRRHRLARGRAGPAQRGNGRLPARRGGRSAAHPPGRHHQRAGSGRDRRGPSDRRRAGDVPGAAAGGRQRDDPEHDVRGPGRAW